jgi:hypothetical protein
MVKKYYFCLFAVLILFFLATNTHAFDNQRKGFLLGIGLGSGYTSFTQEVDMHYWEYHESVESDRENKVGFATDFKIGYAPDNSWAIYYNSKVSWFGIENYFGDDVTIANGLGTVAACHWFAPQAPSPFIVGGLGYSTWSLPFEKNASDTWVGPGLFIGGGYEYSMSWSIEGSLSWGKPKDKEIGIEASTNVFSIMVTINLLGY